MEQLRVKRQLLEEALDQLKKSQQVYYALSTQNVIDELEVVLRQPDITSSVLSKVSYKFFYKDKFGQMCSKVVEVDEKDCELAIAKFEKENSEINWRSFTVL